MPKLQVQLAGELPTGVDSSVVTKVTDRVNQAELSDNEGTVNLKFVTDTEITKLNQQFAGINEPTDVLSFPYGESEELGDIAISYETAARQAKAAGTSLSDEIATLLTHGLLHILGFDHQTIEEQKRIDSLQASIIKEAGYIYRKVEWKNE